MGACVLVLGRSGSGKTSSLRNFQPGEIGVLNVLGKPMPFRARLDVLDHPDYRRIKDCIASGRRMAWVVDDAGYLMANENFARAREPGFGKFTEMAVHFQELARTVTLAPRDCITYLFMHVDADEVGREKPRVPGKMLEQQWCIEGAAAATIDCEVRDGRHVFVTANDGLNLAKVPPESLPSVMDNDLRAVDAALRDYWGLAPLTAAKKEEKVEEA